MSDGSPPPQMPPQVSPDGRWVWDGRQWQPVPIVVGDVAGVVGVAGVAPAVAAAAAPTPAPYVVQYSPPQVQAPVIPYAVPAPEVSAVPLWEQERSRRGGLSLYLFAAAALVVLIMAMMALNSLNIVRMPWQSDGQVATRPMITPTPPLAVRSDAARAESFLAYSVAPHLLALNNTLPALTGTCNGTTLSYSCQEAITATDQQLTKILAMIDHANIPLCIGGGVTKLRADLAGMQSGMALAESGYKKNEPALLAAGIGKFNSLNQSIQPDVKALEQAQKTQCNTQQVGA
jgi:hypothetical protein